MGINRHIPAVKSVTGGCAEAFMLLHSLAEGSEPKTLLISALMLLHVDTLVDVLAFY